MASRRDDLLLEGEFALLSKKKTLHHVTLTRSALYFHIISNNNPVFEEKCVKMSDVIGCHRLEPLEKKVTDQEESPSTTPESESHETINHDHQSVFPAGCKPSEVTHSPDRYIPRATDASSCGFVVFAYPFRKKMFSGKKVRSRQVLAFEVTTVSGETTDERKQVAETWRNVISCLCQDEHVDVNNIPGCVPPMRKRMLLLINPFSGPGKAYTIFKKEIAPVLYEACISYKVIVTEHAGHAGEMMKTIDLSEWYGVVIVSGDGLIFETINGIMQRDDWASSIKLPIGCLPGGSGNALCCSINYSAGEPLDSSLVLHSTFILVKHHVVPMDLVVVHIPNQTIFSFLSVTWGIVADIDYESEKYRKLGEARFTVGALMRIIGLRSYRGRVSFLPVAEYSPKVNSTSSKVLSKIRRFTLQSRSSSRTMLDSEDSKSNNSCNLNNVAHIENHSQLAENCAKNFPKSTNTSKGDEGSCDAEHRKAINNHLNNFNDGEEGTSLHQKNDVYVTHHAHLGAGDAKVMKNADLENVDSVETNGSVHLVHVSASPTSDQEGIDHKSSMHIANCCVTSDLTPDMSPENDNNAAVKEIQLDNCKPESVISDRVINGCSIGRDRSMTILSDSEEVKVEEETYHVTKADFSPVPTPLLLPLSQEVPTHWVTLEGRFVFAIAIYQSHLGSSMLAAPDAHLSDGHIHLMMVREGIPRNALLSLFLTFDQGKHVYSPYVEVVKVLAFRFEPSTKEGNLMVDGERFDPTPIQGQILPGLARVMAIK